MSIKDLVTNILNSAETAALEDKLAILNSKFNNLAKTFSSVKKPEDVEALWDLLVASDPTKGKTYLQWIIVRGISEWTKKNLKLFKEDLPKITDTLNTFEKLKAKNKLKPEHKDINKFKMFTELAEALSGYTDMESNKDKKNNIEKEFFDNKEAELFYNSSEFKVVVPLTEKASCYFGINTQWCTAAKNHNEFKNYNKRGKLYIVLHKPTNRRWQLQFAKDFSFMDENDNAVDMAKLYKNDRSLLDSFRSIFSKIVSEIYTRDLYKAFYFIEHPTLNQTIAFTKSVSKPTFADLDIIRHSNLDSKAITKVLKANKNFALLKKVTDGNSSKEENIQLGISNPKLIDGLGLSDNDIIEILKIAPRNITKLNVISDKVWKYFISLPPRYISLISEDPYPGDENTTFSLRFLDDIAKIAGKSNDSNYIWSIAETIYWLRPGVEALKIAIDKKLGKVYVSVLAEQFATVIGDGYNGDPSEISTEVFKVFDMAYDKGLLKIERSSFFMAWLLMVKRPDKYLNVKGIAEALLFTSISGGYDAILIDNPLLFTKAPITKSKLGDRVDKFLGLFENVLRGKTANEKLITELSEVTKFFLSVDKAVTVKAINKWLYNDHDYARVKRSFERILNNAGLHSERSANSDTYKVELIK